MLINARWQTSKEDVSAIDEQGQADPAKQSWFSKLTSGLSRSSAKLGDGITGIFTKRKLDDETLEELEDILIQADLGVDIATRITGELVFDAP